MMKTMRVRMIGRVVTACALVLLASRVQAQGFEQRALTSDVPAAFAVAVADFDGDGDLDVAATGSSSAIAVWIETRDGGFYPHNIWFSGSGGPRGLAAGDFDGDGDADLVIAAYGESRFVLLRNRGSDTGGRFEESALVPFANGAWSACAGDMDGDSDADLVTTEYTGNTVRIFRQENGALVQIGARSVPYPFDAVFIDFDHDGDSDVLGCSDTQPVFWIEQSAGAWTLHSLNIGVSATGIAAADFNQDGYTDVVAALFRIHRVVCWRGGPSGFTADTLAGVVVNPRDVGVADFDLDGDVDIVAVGQGGDMRWWRNENGTSFTGMTVTPIASSLYGLAVSDFDQDGDPDVLAADYAAAQVVFYRNNMGTPAFLMGTVTAASSGAALAGVRIRLREAGVIGITDANGAFRLAAGEGVYTVVAEHPCWNGAQADSVELTRADTTEIALALTRPLALAEVTSLNVTVPNRLRSEFLLPLANRGDGEMTVHAVAEGRYENDEWLYVSPAETTIAPGGRMLFTVAIEPDTTNSGAWDYYGEIELHTDACPDSVIRVGVFAYVLEVPERAAPSPNRLALHPVYPNPFNAEATAEFELPRDEDVVLKLYDVTGREARVLLAGRRLAGAHRVPIHAQNLPGGVYFLTLAAGGETRVQKLMLIK